MRCVKTSLQCAKKLLHTRTRAQTHKHVHPRKSSKQGDKPTHVPFPVICRRPYKLEQRKKIIKRFAATLSAQFNNGRSILSVIIINTCLHSSIFPTPLPNIGTLEVFFFFSPHKVQELRNRTNIDSFYSLFLSLSLSAR